MLSKEQLIERERSSLEFYIEEIEFLFDCYQENEYLVIKLIDLLKLKYNLLF